MVFKRKEAFVSKDAKDDYEQVDPLTPEFKYDENQWFSRITKAYINAGEDLYELAHANDIVLRAALPAGGAV